MHACCPPTPQPQVNFTEYKSESDPGPYPIPANASIEGAYPGCPVSTCLGDRHVVVLDNATCLLYEVGWL